jgi:hypothetical protein
MRRTRGYQHPHPARARIDRRRRLRSRHRDAQRCSRSANDHCAGVAAHSRTRATAALPRRGRVEGRSSNPRSVHDRLDQRARTRMAEVGRDQTARRPADRRGHSSHRRTLVDRPRGSTRRHRAIDAATRARRRDVHRARRRGSRAASDTERSTRRRGPWRRVSACSAPFSCSPRSPRAAHRPLMPARRP